jgi:myo-inositol 2-dehydrogenase / D-chiro-inositol 1-dehydrogenase
MTANLNERTSRRDFMKTSTVAAVGTGLLGGLALSPRAYAAGSDRIRIGLVGCGGRGSGAANQALSTKGNVQLVAMADAFEDQLQSSLRSLQKQFESQPERVAVEPDHQFTGFDAYEKLLASPIDLVILATPPGFRPIHFEAAVKAGKNIFTEKPLGVDGPGVRRVLAANEHAKEKNLKIGVGLQRHHQIEYLETIDRLKSGAIGDILAMRVYWNDGGVWEPRKSRQQVKSEMEYQMRNWYYYTWLCGDHIVEQHIHNLDVANWIKGDHPVRCWGIGGRQVLTDKRYGEIFDHHVVEYEYPDGSRCFSQCRHQPACWNSVTEHAIGSKGTANVSGYSIKSQGNDWRYHGHHSQPYQVEHDDLFAAIRANRSYNEVDNGAASTMTAIMGRMATYSGKKVEWDAALNSQIDLMPERFAWDAEPRNLPLPDGSYAIPVPGVTKAV